MPVEISPHGTITCTGDGINLFRMLSLRGALKLECAGLRHSRGVSIYALIKREFGLRGNKQRVLEQFSKLCDEVSAKVERIHKEEP